MRKLIPAVIALFAAGASHALGFGELSLNSALNQPLDATVELLAVKPSERESVKVRIADPDIFERFGLSRSPALDDVRVEVAPIPGSDRLRVALSTRRLVREPFLSLLLEASWHGGRALREYTVLLDPPVQTPAARVPASTASESAAERFEESEEPTAVREPESVRTAPAPAPARTRQAPAPRPTGATGSVSRRSRPVVNNETLWGIAREVRPDSRIGMNQMLVAIYRANPQAFGGNMNRLYAGATLAIPDADEIWAVDRGVARREVIEQTRAFESGDRIRTVSTRSRAAAVAPAPPAGELRLEPPASPVEETATIDLAAGESISEETDAAAGTGQGSSAGEDAAGVADAAGMGAAADTESAGGSGKGADEPALGIPVAKAPPVDDVTPAEAKSVVPEGSESLLSWRNILLALAVFALAATPFLWLRRRQQYEPLSEDFSTPIGPGTSAAEMEQATPAEEQEALPETTVAPTGGGLAPDAPHAADVPEDDESQEEETATAGESGAAPVSEEFALDFDFGDETAPGENDEHADRSVGGANATPPGLDVDFSEFESSEGATQETDDTVERREVEEVAEEDEFADFNFDSLSLEETDTVEKPGEGDETAADGDGDDLGASEESQEATTKLDLARAYLDMGELEMARGLLEEVKGQGNAEQRREAEDLLERAG
jgi:pilus assembly protein FimV